MVSLLPIIHPPNLEMIAFTNHDADPSPLADGRARARASAGAAPAEGTARAGWRRRPRKRLGGEFLLRLHGVNQVCNKFAPSFMHLELSV